MITNSKQISTHFHSSEFRCSHCGVIKIDEDLVNKMEHIFSKLNASKCIISSGYRCAVHDRAIGGFLGRHYEGLASDCIYYDKSGKPIPSKIVICVAYDLGELNGIAKINDNYTHLDNRSGSTYRGDELLVIIRVGLIHIHILELVLVMLLNIQVLMYLVMKSG